jgi:hypothetical protein
MGVAPAVEGVDQYKSTPEFEGVPLTLVGELGTPLV